MAELKTFLFTDICRSVDLKNEMIGRDATERDAAFVSQILSPHRERIGENLAGCTGRIVSTAGDGHFLVFQNTVLAAQWAAEVQRTHRDTPVETPGGGRVEVRISMHVGVPQIDPSDPDNFVGKTVDYTARLNDYANGSQILVSRSVMAILDDIGLEGISFHTHGRKHLKGIGLVEVYEMLYDDQGPRQPRQRPQSHSDREWTVIPTVGFEGGDLSPSGGSDVKLEAPPTLKRAGNYQLEEVLGSGGMGDVYKGRHLQFGRVRAVKVIKPQYVASGNKEMIRRFYQEIKAVGALEHKNVVVAIDSSTPEDRLHYLVMEYIDGVAVNDLVDQTGHLSVPDACEIIRQAARGLQYIHRNNMVHRDLKPSNLMVTLVDGDGTTTDMSAAHDVDEIQGVVKILDLGLALLAEDQAERLTVYDNRAMGTGMYMSPEQWKTTSVDIRADIYSLGCTLYHLLAGNPPFFDSDLRPEKAHEKSVIPPIRTGDNIPRKLWEVLQKMTAKRPGDRYDTPAEVSLALTPFAEEADLAALVRNYVNPEHAPTALRRTRIDSGMAIDTWLSRANHLYPTRRWVLRRGLPLVGLGMGVAGLIWSVQESRRRMLADSMRRERNSLLKFAEEAATKFVGKEITHRFEILLAAAADEQMIKMVQEFDPETVAHTKGAHPLIAWIERRRKDNIDTPSSSWFIDDAKGRQIARHPFVKDGHIVDSFMQDYSYRDYFHGEDRDRDPDDTEGVLPISAPNISAAYVSSSSGKLKVAFSVPIWATDDSGERSVIGVLASSFNLGDFKVSGLTHSSGKQIVLVDMRTDYQEGEPKRGMILNHEHQSIWDQKHPLVDGKRTPPRVSSKVQAAMLKADDHFIAGYRDPLSVQPDVSFWGAFEAVEYQLPNPETRREESVPAGWTVLVQTPAIEL